MASKPSISCFNAVKVLRRAGTEAGRAFREFQNMCKWRSKMRKRQRYVVYLLLILSLLILPQAQTFAQSSLGNNVQVVTPPQPYGWWSTAHPYRWEYVEGGHWLAVWACTHAYNQHYVPGDWQTCASGYGCISSWTWWQQYPEAKLGVPSHWRSIWPGAQNLNNYVATCYFQ